MNDEVKSLYIDLLTRRGPKYTITETKDQYHTVALMKANQANVNGDVFKIGDDIYANFRVYTVIAEESDWLKSYFLCPNVEYFRRFWPGK